MTERLTQCDNVILVTLIQFQNWMAALGFLRVVRTYIAVSCKGFYHVPNSYVTYDNHTS